MAVKWETVQAGDVLWRVSSGKMGRSALRTKNIVPVKIVEIDHEAGYAMVSSNNNPVHRSAKRHVCALRRNKPETETTVSGSTRIVPRKKRS